MAELWLERTQANSARTYQRADARRRERFELTDTRFLQPGLRLGEFGSEKSGVAQKFRFAVEQALDRCRERVFSQRAREPKTEQVIGHTDAAGKSHAPIQSDGGQRPANVGYGEFFSQAHDGAKDAREQVCMLVRIEMGGLDAAGDDLLNLGAQFRIWIELLKEQTGGSFRERSAIQNRAALDEDQMAAYIECRCFMH